MKSEEVREVGEKVIYTTLAGSGEAEYTEKKSVFIGYAAHVESEEEALARIKERKKEFYDARHNVSAYLLRGETVARYSDDGEPQGTAGVPVLDTVKKCGVTDAVVVVTRYFGGILLGAGGLVRAYSHTARLALDAAQIITYEQYTELEIVCSYAEYQRYLPELSRFGAVVDDTDFSDRVRVRFAVKDAATEGLCLRVRELSGGATEARVCGKRFDYR